MGWRAGRAWGRHREGTWKELKKRSKKSLAERRVPWACSSVTKANTTSWTPNRGMRVSVDLASLWGHSLRH